MTVSEKCLYLFVQLRLLILNRSVPLCSYLFCSIFTLTRISYGRN